VIDGPGFTDLEAPTDKTIGADGLPIRPTEKHATKEDAKGNVFTITDRVFMMDARETIRVKVGNGNWVTLPDGVEWHTKTWLTVRDGKWLRKANQNFIRHEGKPIGKLHKPPM
jgi:hypothetical protein